MKYRNMQRDSRNLDMDIYGGYMVLLPLTRLCKCFEASNVDFSEVYSYFGYILALHDCVMSYTIV